MKYVLSKHSIYELCVKNDYCNMMDCEMYNNYVYHNFESEQFEQLLFEIGVLATKILEYTDTTDITSITNEYIKIVKTLNNEIITRA